MDRLRQDLPMIVSIALIPIGTSFTCSAQSRVQCFGVITLVGLVYVVVAIEQTSNLSTHMAFTLLLRRRPLQSA